MANSSSPPWDGESDKFTTKEERTSTACLGESRRELSSHITIDLNNPPPTVDDMTVDAAEEPASDQQRKKRTADAAPHGDSPPAKRIAAGAEPPHQELYSPWHVVDAVTAAGIETSFESFPYYLCDVTKEELLSCAYLHLSMNNNFFFSSSPEDDIIVPSLRLPSLSHFLLLSGPPGSHIYQETLAKALAKEFGADLVIYDPVPMGASVLDNKVKFPTLPQIVSDASRLSKYGRPLVVFLSDVYIRDIEQTITVPTSTHCKWSDELNALLDSMPEGVLVIGSHVLDPDEEESPFDLLIGKQSTMSTTAKRPPITRIFPTNYVTVGTPQEESQALSLKRQLDLDCGTLMDRRNIRKILYFLDLAGWTCDTDLDTISIKDEVLTDEAVDRIVGFAVSHHLRTKGSSEDDQGRVLSTKSIEHGLKLLQAVRAKGSEKKSAIKDMVVAYNEYEKRVLTEVIPPTEIGVTFDDVGALDVVKDALWESVLLPLQRPELFRKGRLTKPCKGILLFGPPGTGKTMLAKAVATEAGANFISISMSSITSRWYGEVEKYVKAVFTLASKLAPCVVFIDEVDSMLSSRGRFEEHEVSRRLKNEFMTSWDGLRSKDDERVLVLAATNRPFDLDEAVVRRFPRRLMVGLPDASNREKILRVILSKEELAMDVDFAAIAKITDGFSGSDLKNLCVAAAHRPLREVLEKEKAARSWASAASGRRPLLRGDDLQEDINIRVVEMDDFVYARNHVGASTASSSSSDVTMSRLVEWNNTYGEGGAATERKNVLTYFI